MNFHGNMFLMWWQVYTPNWILFSSTSKTITEWRTVPGQAFSWRAEQRLQTQGIPEGPGHWGQHVGDSCPGPFSLAQQDHHRSSYSRNQVHHWGTEEMSSMQGSSYLHFNCSTRPRMSCMWACLQGPEVKVTYPHLSCSLSLAQLPFLTIVGPWRLFQWLKENFKLMGKTMPIRYKN